MAKSAPKRVFLSSTAEDLSEHRAKVAEAIQRMEQVPVKMETFGARPNAPVDECQRLAAEADALVVVVAHRQGWVPSTEQGGDGEKSITRLEVEAARRAQVPIFAFVVDEKCAWSQSKEQDRLTDTAVRKDSVKSQRVLAAIDGLQELKHWLSADLNVIRDTFTTPEDLALRVSTSLARDWLSQRTAASPLPVEAPEWMSYRHAVGALYAHLDFAGFKTQLRVPIDLSELYVPLYALVDGRAQGDAAFGDAEQAEHTLRRAGAASEGALIDAFAEAAKCHRRGLAILGEPGSGKTTHLKRLLLWCVRQDPTQLGLPAGTLPVFLPLREVVEADTLPRDLAAFLDAQLARQQLAGDAGMGRRLIERGRLLLLFDGLDEVADVGQRERVTRWIERVTKPLASSHAVVTCRFAGYGQARLGAEFLELHLRPLTRDQGEAFIRNWYRSVEAGLPAADRAQAERAALARAEALILRLRESDFRAARVVEMLRNPLLLFNLCLVHWDRGDLPRDRVRLYEECIEVLLERWREGRGLQIPLSAKSGRRALQPAALWLHEREGWLRATSAELAPVLEPGLAAVQYKGDAATFLRAVRDESGLLTGFGQTEYGFMHLGFQEYLAACEIRRRHFEGDANVLREVAAQYGQAWWQEVILILVALGNPSLFVPFMREVVKQHAFARESALLDLVFDDAAEVSAVPFVELVQREPTEEDEPEMSRQYAAINVLAKRFPPIFHRLVRHVVDDGARDGKVPFLPEALIRRGRNRESIVTENGGVELVPIPTGAFMMGSPESEEERIQNEGPQHEVTISPFCLGRYPVTNEEYSRYLQAHPDAPEPEYWGDRRFNQARQPVVGVSWEDAQRFASWAGGRLPTEAEWEYACRAGSVESRYGELGQIGWFSDNSGRQTHPVGEKQASALGLYDMLGNVWEWCSDRYGSYACAAVSDPSGPAVGTRRVVRGGSWINDAGHSRSAQRDASGPGIRRQIIGFRLARSRTPGA